MTTQSTAKIIVDYLITQGFFTDPSAGSDWPLYYGNLPDTESVPDNAAAVYDQAGLKDGRLLSGENLNNPGFQILIRTDDYDDGWAKGAAVESDLETVDGDIVEISSGVSFKLTNLSQLGPLLALGLERGSKRRFLFTINYIATLEEV